MLPIFGSRAGGRKLYYTADLPSFQRDFASLKTLDHGTGPNITFTRGSNATYFDADGVLQTASNDVARFDHSTDGAATSLGLLIEEARTNSIRNSQAGGAAAGVSGTMPTNWLAATPQHGLTREIVATGTVNGLSYIDIKYSGTAGATNGNGIYFETAGAIAAASGQIWTSSVYVGLVGSATGVNAFRLLTEETDGSARLQFSPSTISGLTSSLQRFSTTRTLTDASTTHVRSLVDFSYSNGATVNFTLRIAAPQLEQGAFPTSYIPTTTAAATRAADSAVVTPISSFYNGTEGTIYNEFAPLNLDGTSAVRGVVAFAESSGWLNRLLVGYRGTGAQFFTAVANNVNEFNTSGTASLIAAGTTARAIQAYQTNNSARALNGAAAVAVSGAITAPTRERMLLGQSDAPNFLNGHIRKIAYWPKRLTNTLLEQLTT